MAYQLALTVVMKNWEPLELGPEFTIETTPECRDIKQAERHEDCLICFFFNKRDAISSCNVAKYWALTDTITNSSIYLAHIGDEMVQGFKCSKPL